MFAAIPEIPASAGKAVSVVFRETAQSGSGPAFLIFCGLIGIALIAELSYEKTRTGPENPVRAVFSILLFAFAAAIFFFVINWPPPARVTLLVYILALIGYKLGSIMFGIVVPAKLQTYARVILILAAFACATVTLAAQLGMAPAIADAIAYVFAATILAVALAALWAASKLRQPHKAALTFFMVAVWLLWCLQLRGLFWICLYVLVLPPTLHAVGRMATSPSAQTSALRKVLIARGARAVVIVLAAAWLAIVWRMTPQGLGHANPIFTALFYGLLKSVVVLLAADLCWHLAKAWIDGVLVATGDAVAVTPAEKARRARYRTLLPILKNALAVMIAVMTLLIVLAQLGVEVAPLIAGAGVFGVALGFGSQTLVKDIISGVFYMFDDAFRVGEYIQAKNYKGTVEGFSLRSVRLRHHRGPVFTVPFGELGAVQNMSRDWGVVKFRISVSHAADVEKVRKLTKKIGATMLDDPELAPLFIEPLKMKGIEEFTDYGMVLSFGMTLQPSPMQSFIRRRANLLLREEFMANGIDFATPSVQVEAEGRADAAAAATSLRANQLKAVGPTP
ncbi:mechanosensitive ion channel family protein [Endobacterium cereale]|uniref:mechanosensitive ion channel family protein n=1 Tax=Endobacterium cereale TaxID=2663029 RepID=UPI001F3F5991|nr:mechanosensitive ion channel family protein [Endobacterium cereale]